MKCIFFVIKNPPLKEDMCIILGVDEIRETVYYFFLME
jgi:hypothetical protein